MPLRLLSGLSLPQWPLFPVSLPTLFVSPPLPTIPRKINSPVSFCPLLFLSFVLSTVMPLSYPRAPAFPCFPIPLTKDLFSPCLLGVGALQRCASDPLLHMKIAPAFLELSFIFAPLIRLDPACIPPPPPLTLLLTAVSFRKVFRLPFYLCAPGRAGSRVFSLWLKLEGTLIARLQTFPDISYFGVVRLPWEWAAHL